MTDAARAAQPFVLVVDDDPLQRREIVRCLDDIGIPTKEAGDGLEAITLIRNDQPAIVIMDIRMPHMDGVDAANSLRDLKGYRPKIILITGDPESLYRANQMRLNIFGVIEKPVPLRTLSRFVTSAMTQVGRD